MREITVETIRDTVAALAIEACCRMPEPLLDAMRADFQAYSPEFRSKLLAMICEAEPERADWWWGVLVGEGDPLYRALETI